MTRFFFTSKARASAVAPQMRSIRVISVHTLLLLDLNVTESTLVNRPSLGLADRLPWDGPFRPAEASLPCIAEGVGPVVLPSVWGGDICLNRKRRSLNATTIRIAPYEEDGKKPMQHLPPPSSAEVNR